MNNVNERPLAVSIPEAARLLGISRDQGYRLAATGELPILSLGRRRKVVPRRAIDAMLEAAGTGAPLAEA